MEGIVAIILCLVGLLIYSGLRALNYYLALCGVLYYLNSKYDDELSVEEIRRLTIEAAKNIHR